MPERRLPVRRILVTAFVLAFGGGAAVGSIQRYEAPAAPAQAALAGDAAAAFAPLPPAAAPEVGAPPAPSAPASVPARALAEARKAIEGTLARGQTLAEALSSHGVSAEPIFTIVREMSPAFDFRYSMPGDRFRVELGADGRVERFHYERSASERYELVRDGEVFSTRHHKPQILRRQARIAGVVRTSLHAAVEELGETPALAEDFAKIFAWDVDFSRGARRGDEFSILYERLYTVDEGGSESYARPGQILAARYTTGGEELSAVYFETARGHGAYYRPDGSPVERQFLKAPVEYSRISSSFTKARLHPILKIWRPHLGIDYAAPRGTPVWSVANGKVIFKGYQGGYGNLVKVRHASGYVSYYAHLSRFAPGLRVGQRVSQKQVLGQVGSTGLSTGPHLCFRLTKEGDFVNPATLHAAGGEPLPRALQARFKQHSGQLMAALDPRPLVVTNEAL